MGSYNIPCIVTQTPLSVGDKCVFITFREKDGEFQSRVECGDGIPCALSEHFVAVHFGKYDDYGRMDNPKAHELDALGSYDEDGVTMITYAVSLEAWEFVSKKYKDRPSSIVAKSEPLVALADMSKRVEDDYDPEWAEMVEKARKNMKNAETFRILEGIHYFGQANNFNPFGFAFSNFYAGQQWNFTAKREWMELRQDRINRQIIKEKKYDSMWSENDDWR